MTTICEFKTFVALAVSSLEKHFTELTKKWFKKKWRRNNPSDG